MALRGPRPTFLLTLALLAACVALTLGQNWNPLNDIFRKNHVDFPKTPAINNNAYCNKMMWDRVMYLKYTNTFIHATVKDINKVCTTAGLSAGPYRYVSTSSFKITTCIFNPWSISYTGISAEQKIVISCLNRLPVLYAKSI
ncbi:ankyrin and armadillo repeat-containing protein [Platysternon megacephalum]|uniref:Ankyrin and armadillo repeat-containing protein n=1 Tax=Platysternon megacephalum TaxID=55544 RepID=A0A4D9DI27_9SAUR|nr:ankyrin and armadillo repeat-containing protein [Platysternon megacephalum]